MHRKGNQWYDEDDLDYEVRGLRRLALGGDAPRPAHTTITPETLSALGDSTG